MSGGREEAGELMKRREAEELEDGCVGRQNHEEGEKQLHRGKTTENIQEVWG